MLRLKTWPPQALTPMRIGRSTLYIHTKQRLPCGNLCAAETRTHWSQLICSEQDAALQVTPGLPASRSSCVGQKGRASSQRSIEYHSRPGLHQENRPKTPSKRASYRLLPDRNHRRPDPCSCIIRRYFGVIRRKLPRIETATLAADGDCAARAARGPAPAFSAC
jgi:hypothetical protein